MVVGSKLGPIFFFSVLVMHGFLMGMSAACFKSLDGIEPERTQCVCSDHSFRSSVAPYAPLQVPAKPLLRSGSGTVLFVYSEGGMRS